MITAEGWAGPRRDLGGLGSGRVFQVPCLHTESSRSEMIRASRQTPGVPRNLSDPADQMASTAAPTLHPTRAGGQDDISISLNKLPQINQMSEETQNPDTDTHTHTHTHSKIKNAQSTSPKQYILVHMCRLKVQTRHISSSNVERRSTSSAVWRWTRSHLFLTCISRPFCKVSRARQDVCILCVAVFRRSQYTDIRSMCSYIYPHV